MHYSAYPTLLGGKRAKLSWHELNPDELVTASHSSRERAAALLELADEQIAIAQESQDQQRQFGYEIARAHLARIAGVEKPPLYEQTA